jgi:heterodisulfide reductase subunit C
MIASQGQGQNSAIPSVRLSETRLSSRLRGLIPEKIELCFQCQKCASGCPVAYVMDYTPPQLLRMILLGMDEQVFGAKTAWLCASCETCTTRCPQGIDIARVMDGVREAAIAEKKKAAVPRALAFNKLGVWNLKTFGRMYELGLIGLFKMKTFDFLSDIGLGRRLFFKGKIRLFPSFKGRRAMWRIASRVSKKESGA